MEANRSRLSVVVPLYNKRAYILRCLNSIRLQTMPDFEVIVVDDGSTDGSAEEAKRIGDDRFRILSQSNAGAAAARNRGVEECAAGIVAFLDADDEWEPDFLHAIIRLSKAYPNAGLYGTGYRRILDTGEVRETAVIANRTDEHCLVDNYFRAALSGDFVTSSSVAIPKPVFLEAGGFLVGERFGEDRDLWVRIGLRHQMALDRRILAIYHSEAEHRSYHGGYTVPYPVVVRRLKKVLPEMAADDPMTNDIRRYMDDRLLQYAYALVTRGNRADLLQFLRSEVLYSAPSKLEAAMLRLLAPWVPLRLLQALKVRSKVLFNYIRCGIAGTPGNPVVSVRRRSQQQSWA